MQQQLLEIATKIAHRERVRWKLRAEEIEPLARRAVEVVVAHRARVGRETCRSIAGPPVPIRQDDRGYMVVFMVNTVIARRRVAVRERQVARRRAKLVRR